MKKLVIAIIYCVLLFSSLAIVNAKTQVESSDLQTTKIEKNPELTQNNKITIIDVMIVYTSETVEALGNEQAVIALAHESVNVTNQAFANSLVDLRLRLVNTYQVNYQEDQSSNPLSQLSNPDDGVQLGFCSSFFIGSYAGTAQPEHFGKIGLRNLLYRPYFSNVFTNV